MQTFNVVIKTKGPNAAYHVGFIEAPYVGDAILGASNQFSAATGLLSGKDFNVAILTNEEADAFDAGTYSPFAAAEAFNAKAAA